jgi:hypothetical protein
MSPRARRYLHMLGAILALIMAVIAGLVGVLLLAKDPMMAVGYLAAAALLVAYVLYAQRRSVALEKEEARRSGEEASQAFDRLRSSPEFTTGVTLRWRARTYFLFVVLLAALGAATVWGWYESLWLLVGLCVPMFAWAAKSLLARLAEPDVMRVGPQGIEDLVRFGTIPWQDVTQVFLHESEIKGTKVSELSLEVRDPAAYLSRLGPLARLARRAETLGFRRDLRFPLQTLNMAPGVVFRVIRAFHERTLPPGAISGADHFYMVDLEGAELKAIMAELDKIGAGPLPADLAARMDAAIKALPGKPGPPHPPGRTK